MNGLGLGVRHAVRGDKETWLRTGLAAFGVAVAMFALLCTGAAAHIAVTRIDRTAAMAPTREGTAAEPYVWTRQDTDLWQGSRIRRVLVDRTTPGGGRVIPPPGMGRLPSPSDCVVSPALARLMETPGADQLRRRYCGGHHTLIGDAGLGSPDELTAWVGYSPLQGREGAVRAFGFGDDAVGGRVADSRVQTVYTTTAAVTALVCVPLAILVSACVRVSSERRHRRIAALRLSGATRRQAGAVLTGEVLFVCALGVAAGWLFFLPARLLPVPWLSFFPHDARPGAFGIAATLLLPLVGVGIARRGAARAVAAPYAVRRAAEPRPLRWRAALPLVGGLLILVGLTLHHQGGSGGDQTLPLALLYLSMVLSLLGVPLALPLAVRGVASTRGRRTRRLSLQLAGRRLERGFGDTARASAALVVGMVALSTAGLLLSTYDHAATDFLVRTLRTPAGKAVTVEQPSAAVARLPFGSLPGVRGAVPLRTYQEPAAGPGEVPSPVSVLVADCAQLKVIWPDALRHCPSGPFRLAAPDRPSLAAAGQRVTMLYAADPAAAGPRVTLTVPARTLVLPDVDGAAAFTADVVVPPGSPALAGLPLPRPAATLVLTDGGSATEAAVRSRVLAADPAASLDSTAAQLAASKAGLAPYRIVTLAVAAVIGVLLLVTLVVTGCDAAVGRRRATAALVVTGADTAVLRRAQLWYLNLPMALGCGLAVGVDLLLNAAFDRITTGHVGAHPAALLVLGGVAVAGMLAAAPSALLMTGRRPDPGLLRAE